MEESSVLVDKEELGEQRNISQACALIDEERFEKPRRILWKLLDEQNENGRDSNNRLLLWVRLTLATLLRANGRGDEVGALFYGIVTVVREGDMGSQFERIEWIQELNIAENALP